MLKSLGASCVILVMTASGSFAQRILYPAQSEAAAPKQHSGTRAQSGTLVYWTASGPLYIDQQLDALSRLIFPYSDQQRFLWLNNRMEEQLDRQEGRSYSIRIR